MSDDKQAFMAEMADVTPLKASDKASVDVVKDQDVSIEAKRQAAVAEVARDSNPLATDHIQMLGPYDELSFKRDGLQTGVFRKFRLGGYPAEARLDLHHMGVEQARQEVFNFIKECRKYDLRTVIILHGKGDRGHGPKALLKSYTAHWLKELDDVMAYHTAQPQHGGGGAVYVMLRKSEKLKRANREQHGGRHG